MERVEKGGANQGGWTLPALGLMARPCMHAAAFMLMMITVSGCEALHVNFAVIKLGANRCYQIVAGNGPGFTRLDTATNHLGGASMCGLGVAQNLMWGLCRTPTPQRKLLDHDDGFIHQFTPPFRSKASLAPHLILSIGQEIDPSLTYVAPSAPHHRGGPGEMPSHHAFLPGYTVRY